MTSQAGARHCADVLGTFSGSEYAPATDDSREAEDANQRRLYPLWERALIDPDSEMVLLRMWGRIPEAD